MKQSRSVSVIVAVLSLIVPIRLAVAESLPIPPILESAVNAAGEREYRLEINEGTKQFIGAGSSTTVRTTPTLGYNGDYLGPTIRVRRDDAVRLRVTNNLNEATTTHWHGTHLPAASDGGPHQIIAAGATWDAAFVVDQPAATLWYHPHLDGATARHVYAGLAGLMIIDDQESDRLALPRRYGRDDIPLILQERAFGRDGTFAYRPARPDVMHGYAGNEMLVNGAIEPDFAALDERVRFRVLNGSNSSVLRVAFDDDHPFQIIASDGGFLAVPVEATQIVLSPGERYEIVVNVDPQSTARRPMILEAESHLTGTYRVLELYADDSLDPSPAVPSVLTRLSDVPGAVVERREFVMSTMGRGGMLTINGRSMDMERVDARVRLGDTEIWTIVNAQSGMGRGMGGMMGSVPHTFHVHGLQFRVERINGRRPPPQLSGWKDTVLLWPGDRVEIRLRFEDYTGLFMYHCHLLEHEDAGMMGQVEVFARR